MTRSIYGAIVEPDEIIAWLGDHYRRDDLRVERIGAGAWSTAYRFELDGADLVLRVGESRSDFEKDRAAARFTSDALPIPQVHSIGSFGADAHHCISDFVPGSPIEQVDAEAWEGLVPSLVDAMEAMRSTGPPGPGSPWHSILRRETGEADDPRIARWRRRLAADDRASEAFVDGTRALHLIEVGDVAPSLVHADLVNRNAFVDGGRLSGIFDWGCMMWGDPLYDLASIEFWSPWYPALDVEALSSALHRRWARDGITVERFDDRRRACLLHVGLEHIIYNAVMANPDERDAVITRMSTLGLV